MERIGIVGRGLAGLRVASELRAGGYENQIITWDSDPYPPYDRPALSKKMFGEYNHPLSADGLGDFTELGADSVPHPATRAWSEEGKWFVLSQNGVSEPLDVLVIATGSAPRAVIPGARVLYDVDDAEALRAAIKPGARIHIVGAGWIGTEIASVAAHQGAEVEMWEATPSVLSRTFSGAVDDLWLSWMREAGVKVNLDSPYSGDRAGRDLLIQATGVQADVAFLDGGARSPHGSLVANLRGEVIEAESPTSAVVPGLYATGDCCDILLPNGQWRWGGHWTQALADAQRTVSAILELPGASQLDAPEVFSTQFGHEIGLVGEVPVGTSPTVEQTGESTIYRWMDHSGNLVALLGIDAPREVSRARKALRHTL